MHISENFVVREIAGENVIVPTGTEAQNFLGLVTVNKVGAFLWSCLQQENMTVQGLADRLCRKYDVDEETARKDVEEFTQILRDRNMLIED